MTQKLSYQLSLPSWKKQQKEHEAQVDAKLADYLWHRERQHKHPVLDFLFEYYNFRPAALRKWTPGAGVVLTEATIDDFPDDLGFSETPNGRFLDPTTLPEQRHKGLLWVRTLLRKTLQRKPLLGCFGLHEWAMVYKSDTRQHPDIPLRLPPEKITAIVEERPLVCTHFDAFRFFTNSARPLNKNQLIQKNMPQMEQPGCLHANMDVYKWAYKFYPWVSSALIFDAFLLAWEIRELDMRASPYQLSAWGYEPVCIETPDGRSYYKARQMQFMEQAQILRNRLLSELEILVPEKLVPP